MVDYASYINLIEQIDDLVGLFERHPDSATREQAVALLSGLDALHREGLRRLVDSVREGGGEVLIERAAADPIVEILLGIYGLVDLELPDAPQDQASGFVPLDAVTVFADPAPDGGTPPPDRFDGQADEA